MGINVLIYCIYKYYMEGSYSGKFPHEGHYKLHIITIVKHYLMMLNFI